MHEQAKELKETGLLAKEYRKRMEKAETSNRDLHTHVEKTEQELEDLKAEVKQLRSENRDLKTMIERLSAIFHVPFKLEEGLAGEQLLQRATALCDTERQLKEVVATHTLVRAQREQELKEMERLALLAQQRERELASTSSALTELQRQIQRAQDVGEALEEIGGSGSEGISLRLTARDRDLQEVSRNHQEYLTIFSTLEAMEAEARKMVTAKLSYQDALSQTREKYYGRHASFIKRQIAEINAHPSQLNNLKLFTQFFGVTDTVSKIKETQEFTQLKANRTMLKHMAEKSGQEEEILRLTKQNGELTTALLRRTMGLIHEATNASSGRSRYKNFGLHLLMWNDILNNLNDSFYHSGDRANALKYEDAELLRCTVRKLNTQFYRSMARSHTQKSPGVWVPN